MDFSDVVDNDVREVFLFKDDKSRMGRIILTKTGFKFFFYEKLTIFLIFKYLKY